MGGQDDVEPLSEVVGGYGSPGPYGTSVVGEYGTSVGRYGSIWEPRTIWNLCCRRIWNLCGKIWEDMGALGISVGGCGRIREVRTIWKLCGKMWELSTYGISVGGVRGYGSSGRYGTSVGGYGSSAPYGISVGGWERIRELRTIWNLCGKM